jgi:S-adenosylmethionine hydrolase
MKAVILSICPDAIVVDISHQIKKFDVRMGAYILASAAPYFPTDTIHVAVVDPGVGTGRRGLIAHSKNAFLVGPDNGVLALAAASAPGPLCIYRIDEKKLMLPHVSNTFHGRDVFAPAAAHLANGKLAREFGLKIREMVMPKFGRVARGKDMVVGEVIHVDGFGNIVTNLSRTHLRRVRFGQMMEVELKGERLRFRFCRTYGEVEMKKSLALIGSHGFLEISVNQGNAAEVFGVRSGDRVAVCPS